MKKRVRVGDFVNRLVKIAPKRASERDFIEKNTPDWADSLIQTKGSDDAEVWRSLTTARTSVPTLPSRAHPQDDGRSHQLPQIMKNIISI